MAKKQVKMTARASELAYLMNKLADCLVLAESDIVGVAIVPVYAESDNGLPAACVRCRGGIRPELILAKAVTKLASALPDQKEEPKL